MPAVVRKAGLTSLVTWPPVRRAARKIDHLDVAVTAGLAAVPFPTAVDRGLPLLTRAADHSKLWMGTAALLALTGNRRMRRAAVRGMGSVAVASAIGNQGAKRLFVRKRPVIETLPMRRMAHRVPTSNSFPSGHSASAVAFAVGASVECPPLAVPLGVLAAGVCASRVYTGVHYPSDVVVGAAIGATVALVGKRLVPAHASGPERFCAELVLPQPPRPTGAGVVAVVNDGSGSGGPESLIERFRAELPDAEVVVVGPDDDIEDAMESAAARAQVLAAIGGDGTVNVGARAAMARDIPLLVVPGGTFDHFAKDLALTDVDAAVEAVRCGHAVRIDVGEADGKPFLNTASLGSYPEFVTTRERWEDRLGKPLAAALAVLSVWRRFPAIDAEVDGVPRRLLLLFVGNGAYRPRGFLPRWRAGLGTGELDVRFAESATKHGLWGLLGAALTSDLYRSKRYVETVQPTLSVKLTGVSGQLSRDGEAEPAPEHVEFTVRRDALTVFCGRPRLPENGADRT